MHTNIKPDAHQEYDRLVEGQIRCHKARNNTGKNNFTLVGAIDIINNVARDIYYTPSYTCH
jgi:hypothetical protein